MHFSRRELAQRRQRACRDMIARGLEGLVQFRQESMYCPTWFHTNGYLGGDGATPSSSPGLALLFLRRILESPFGAVLQAIRENPDRATACGYDINRIKLLSFVFSAGFAGLAGGLNALYLRIVPIDTLYWTTSGQVVMMTLLGGAGTFIGPFVGAGVFLILEA